DWSSDVCSSDLIMKKVRLVLVASLLSVGAISTLTSCGDDTKTCPVGYEGKNCDTEMRTKFVKNWSATDKTAGGTDLVYTCNIVEGSAINSVIISNTFSDNFFGQTINATVDGNTIKIENQKPDGSLSGYAVEGTGTYSGAQISWNYYLIRTA